MAVDVSRIPNNNKFDPVREAILQLQTDIEDTGNTIGNGTLTIGTSGSLTGSGTFTANQSSNSTITIGIDDSDYLSLSDTGEQTIAGDIVISGDLTISGTTTFIDTTHLNIGDNIITLNADLPSTTAPTEDAGIAIYRGSSATKSFLWNETSDKWTLGSETLIAGTFEGNLTGNVTGDVTGNASTASALATARNIAVDGAVTGNADFDGSGDITITTSVNHNHDDRYYTETESDNRFVNVDGDTMTDDLNFNSGSKVRLHSGAFTDANDRYEIFATGDVMMFQYYDDDQGDGTSVIRPLAHFEWGGASDNDIVLYGDVIIRNENSASPEVDVKVLDMDVTGGVVNLTNINDGTFAGDLTANTVTATTTLTVGTTNVYDALPTGLFWDDTDDKFKIGVTANGGNVSGGSLIQPLLLANILNEGYIPYVATGGGGSSLVNSRVSDSWLKLTSDTLELGASDPVSHEIKYARFLWQSGSNDKVSTVYGARDITASVQYLGGSATAKIGFTTGTGAGRIRFNDEFTFPATDGTSGQVLGTNGSGDLSWVSGAATTSDLQVVTDNGNTTTNSISIGTSTASPSNVKLYVESSSGAHLFRLKNTNTSTTGYAEMQIWNDADDKLVLGSIGSGYTSNEWAGSSYIYDTGQSALRIKASNQLELFAGGYNLSSRHLVINSSGLVGIGTSTPTTYQLDVVGTGIRSVRSTAGWAGWFENSGDSSGVIVTAGSASGDAPLLIRKQDGTELFSVRGNGTSWFKNGQVGIGTDTPTTGYLLDVAGFGTFDNGVIINGVETGNPSAATDQIRVSGYGIIGNRGTFYVTNAGGQVQIGNGTSHNQNPTANFNSSNIQLYRTTYITNGVLGVGTTNPNEEIDVRTSAFTSMSVTSDRNTANDFIGSFAFYGRNTAATPQDILYARMMSQMTGVTEGGERGDILFQTRRDAAYIDSLRISSGGNITSYADFIAGSNVRVSDQLIFDKTNTASGGDYDFINIGYNGSWSQNTNGLAAIEVNDGGGTVGKFGITYASPDGGAFVVKNLYNGSGYGGSNEVFRVNGSGNAFIENNLTLNNLYTNNTVYFSRSGVDGNAENFIRSQNYPSQGFTASDARYWLEYNTKGGHHFVVNSDGGAGDTENAYDDFTIWQGAVDGDRLFSVSNTGNTNIAGYMHVGAVVSLGDGSVPNIAGTTIYGSGKVVTPKLVFFNDSAGDDNYITHTDTNNAYTVNGQNMGAWYEFVGDKLAANSNNSAGIVASGLLTKQIQATDVVSTTITVNGNTNINGNLVGNIYASPDGTYDSTPNGTTFTHTLATASGTGTKRVVNFDGNGGNPSVWWTSGNEAIGAIDAMNTTNGLAFWVNSSGGAWQRNFYIDTDRTIFERNIGVGVTSPNEKLHVAGNIRAENTTATSLSYLEAMQSSTQFLRLHHLNSGWTTSGTNIANSGLIVAGSGSTGGLVLRTDANAPIIFATNGTQNERVRITGSGNVGIGTTSPSDKLHISGGDVTIGGSGGTIGTSSAITDAYLKIGATLGFDPNQMLFVGDGYINSTGDLRLAGDGNGASIQMTLNSGGVGINETNPQQALHVAGRVRTTNEVMVNTNRTGIGWVTIAPSGNTYGQIAFNIIDDSNGGTYANVRGDGTYFGNYSTFGNYTTSGDGVQFYDSYSDANSAYYHRPRILAGINDGSTGGVDEADVGLLVHNINGANNTWAKIALGGREAAGAGNTVSWAGIAAKKVSGTSGSWARGNLHFWVKNNATMIDAAHYDYTGEYQGIYKHVLYAGAQIRQGLNLMRSVNNKSGISFYNDTYHNWQIYMSPQGQTGSGANGNLTAATGISTVTSWALRSRMEGVNTYGWLWETGGSGGGGATATAKMELGANSGTLRVTGDVIAYASDQRLKTNVKPIDNAVEKVKQISGVTYDWVDDIETEYGFYPTTMHEAGVLAQEIEKVLPEAVMTAPMNTAYTEKTGIDHDFKTVKYDRIVPLLIEAIKEQQKQIDELKARLDGSTY